MIILGIDPGSIKSGYGLLEIVQNRIIHLDSGTINFNPKTPFLERLYEIKEKSSKLIKQYEPRELALESLIFVKDPKALMKLAQTRGVIIAEALDFCNTSIFEYSPNLIKSTVTGHGHADKESVQKAVTMSLKIKEFKSFDHSDALAVALCHALNRQSARSMVPSKSTRSGSLKAALAHKI